MPAATGYLLRFEGESNRAALAVWLSGDKQVDIQHVDEQTIWISEQQAMERLDYFRAHMEAERIRAAAVNRPGDKPSQWLTLDEMQQRAEAHWIDAVIGEQRIRTVFQPIVSVQDGETTVQGYEFLSRAIEMDGSLIPPFRMFSAAKARNRLFALDRVCRLHAVRNANRIDDRLVFVNFIPTAIYTPEHCLQSTLEEARRSGVNPQNIVFEVVESEEVDNIEHLERILHYYRTHGFRYALDDVGQGFSTLEKVERLKPDFVKLDMHYVQGVATDPDKQQVALDLLRVGQAVGARCLAEGIEEEADWRWLVDAGYELFQGYLFGKPELEPQEVQLVLA